MNIIVRKLVRLSSSLLAIYLIAQCLWLLRACSAILLRTQYSNDYLIDQHRWVDSILDVRASMFQWRKTCCIRQGCLIAHLVSACCSVMERPWLWPFQWFWIVLCCGPDTVAFILSPEKKTYELHSASSVDPKARTALLPTAIQPSTYSCWTQQYFRG